MTYTLIETTIFLTLWASVIQMKNRASVYATMKQLKEDNRQGRRGDLRCERKIEVQF
jgi:hypothetical protein